MNILRTMLVPNAEERKNAFHSSFKNRKNIVCWFGLYYKCMAMAESYKNRKGNKKTPCEGAALILNFDR